MSRRSGAVQALLVLLCALVTAECLAAGAAPAAPPGGPVWPAGRPPVDLTGRLVLDNGFEAFVVPRPGAPLVAILVAVEGGSRHETPATRGAAHLLEHLVFEGTETRGRSEIFRWVYGIGGYLNGFTRDDFTGYILMGPPRELPAMARLLAELLSDARLSAEALDGVEAVVLEELRQARADPGYHDEAAFRAALYHGTPYAAPILGTEETIRAIRLDDLAAFYRRHYTPERMVALAIGGAGADEMTAALRDAFGSLEPAGLGPPPGSPDRSHTPASPAGARPHRTGLPDPPQLPPAGAVHRVGRHRAVYLGLLGPAPSEPSLASFLALGDLLAGPASPLPAALAAAGAPDGLAPDVAAEVATSFSTLELRVPLPDGADADRALAGLVGALSRLAATDAPDAAGAITAATAAAGALHARLEAARLAERIHYFAMARAPLLVAGRPDLALGPAPSAPPDAMRTVLARALARGWTAVLPAPAARAAPGAGRTAPARREARLPNGLTVVAESRPGSPLVAAHLLAEGRLLAEPPDLPGAAELLHRLLLAGPAWSREPLRARLGALGAAITVSDDPRRPFGDFYFARDFSGIRLEALAEGAESALRRLAETITAPSFSPDAVEAARRETADLAAWRAADAGTLAEDRLWARLFDGPLGAPPAGTADSLARATPEALAAFHRRYFAPGNLILSIVGGEPPERLVALAEATFGGLRPPAPAAGAASPGPPPPCPPAAATSGTAPLRLELGQPQAQVRVGLAVPVDGPRERAALSLAVSMLGATLFSSLREEQGLAYSVGADVAFVGACAVVTAGLGTEPSRADRALSELTALVAARAGAQVGPEEVARRAAAVAGRLAARQLSSATRAYYLGAALHEGAPHRFGDDYAALLASIIPEEVEAIQRRAFSRPPVAVVVK